MSIALAAISLANKMFLACQRLHPQPLPTSEEQFPINKKRCNVPLPFTLVNSLIVLCLMSLISYPSLQPTFINLPYMLPTQSHATTEKGCASMRVGHKDLGASAAPTGWVVGQI